MPPPPPRNVNASKRTTQKKTSRNSFASSFRVRMCISRAPEIHIKCLSRKTQILLRRATVIRVHRRRLLLYLMCIDRQQQTCLFWPLSERVAWSSSRHTHSPLVLLLLLLYYHQSHPVIHRNTRLLVCAFLPFLLFLRCIPKRGAKRVYFERADFIAPGRIPCRCLQLTEDSQIAVFVCCNSLCNCAELAAFLMRAIPRRGSARARFGCALVGWSETRNIKSSKIYNLYIVYLIPWLCLCVCLNTSFFFQYLENNFFRYTVQENSLWCFHLKILKQLQNTYILITNTL